MNAGAYGRDWSDVLARALVVYGRRRALARRRRARALVPALRARARARSSRVSSTGSSRGRPRDQGRGRRLVARRKDTQPTNKRTFGSVFKNPPASSARGGCSSSAASRDIASAARMISPKHANFIENAGGATSADCVALMVEARRRAHEEFGVVLEREVVLRRPRGAPARRRNASRRGESGRMAGGRSARGSRRHAAAASVVVPFPRGAAGARLDLVRFVPSGRSLLASFGRSSRSGVAYWVAYATPGLRGAARSTFAGAPPALTREVTRATQRPRRQEPRLDRRDGGSRGSSASSRRSPASPSIARSRTRSSSDRARAAGRGDPARAFRVARDRRRQGHPRDRRRTPSAACRGSGSRAGPRFGSAGHDPRGLLARDARARRGARGGLGGRVTESARPGRRADPRHSATAPSPPRRAARHRHEARHRAARCSPSSTDDTLHRRERPAATCRRLNPQVSGRGLRVGAARVVDIAPEEAYPRERRSPATRTFNTNFSLR